MISLFAKVAAAVAICYGIVSFFHMDISPVSWGDVGRYFFICMSLMSGFIAVGMHSDGGKK